MIVKNLGDFLRLLNPRIRADGHSCTNFATTGGWNIVIDGKTFFLVKPYAGIFPLKVTDQPSLNDLLKAVNRNGYTLPTQLLDILDFS